MTPAHWSALGILALSVGFSAYGSWCQRRAAEDRIEADRARAAAEWMVEDVRKANEEMRRQWRVAAAERAKRDGAGAASGVVR